MTRASETHPEGIVVQLDVYLFIYFIFEDGFRRLGSEDLQCTRGRPALFHMMLERCTPDLCCTGRGGEFERCISVRIFYSRRRKTADLQCAARNEHSEER